MVVKGKGILDATMSMAVSRGYLALALPVLTTLLCCLVTTEARASTMSTWEVRLDPVTGESVASFEIPASRLIRHGLERRESAGDGVADAPVSQVWRAREKELREHLENHLHISTDARTCAPTSEGKLDAIERDGELWLRWRTERRCELPLGRVSFVNASLTRSRFGFHHLGTIRVGDEVHRHVFDATNPVLQLDYSESFTTPDTSNKMVSGVPWLVIVAFMGGCLLFPGAWVWRKRRTS